MRKGKKFSMAYAELVQRGDRVCTLVRRDQEYYTSFGYPEDLPVQLKEQTDAFRDLLPDIYYEGQQMLTTKTKNRLRDELNGLIGDLRFRAKLALGENNTKFRLFRFSSATRMNDKELVSYAKHVTKTAEQFLPELSARLVDQAMLNEITATTTQLDEAIDTQAEAVALREQKRVERVEQANTLYERIVELCEVGKRIWANKNEAHYDDYVLYGSSKSAEAAAGEQEITEEIENL